MGRDIQNYFEGATDTADGIVAGLSKTWYGNGDIELVTLDNSSSSAVIMEQREFGRATAKWVPAGGMTRTSIQRLNFFSSGYEYRARLIESSPTEPLRLTVRTFDQAHRGPRHDMLVEAFSKGHVVGFADPEAKGIIEYGDYDALKNTTAFMFFCYDKDPDLLADFGGAWEKYGVDYRKMHVNETQFLLSVAIDNYINDGGGNTGGGTGGGTGGTGGTGGGGGNEGEVGGPPATRTGTASLVTSPASSVELRTYSSVLAEALWGDPIDENPALDKYEVALNGTIVYIGTGNSKVLNNLTPATQYTISIVRFRDDGSFSLPITASNATPVAGTGGGGNSGGETGSGGGSTDGSGTPAEDGVETTYTFHTIDAHERSYVEAGQGNPAQIWEQLSTITGSTGVGYLATSNINVAQGQGGLAVYTNQFADQSKDRRIWLRVRAEVAGSQVGICSHGTGSLGIISISNTDEWAWIQSPQPWAVLDASLQMYGISGGVAVDKILVQDLDDLAIPTGEQGLKEAA